MVNICKDDMELTDGQVLASFDLMSDQMSCRANTQNMGNYYPFPGATAGSNISSGNASNSICPKGWILPANTKEDNKSFYRWLKTIYNYNSNDNGIRSLPISFIRSGIYYQGALNDRAVGGVYWSSKLYSGSYAYGLRFNSNTLDTQFAFYYYYGIGKPLGYSVRCVAR